VIRISQNCHRNVADETDRYRVKIQNEKRSREEEKGLELSKKVSLQAL